MNMDKMGLLSLVFFLSGCVSVNNTIMGEYKYNTAHSYAWNVSVAGKRNPFFEKKIPLSLSSKLNDGTYYWGSIEDKSDKNLSNKDLTPLMKLDYQVGFALEDWQISSLIAWVPENLASSTTDARNILADTVVKAISESFKQSYNVYKNDDKKGYMNSSLLRSFTFGIGSLGETNKFININFWDDTLKCGIPKTDLNLSEKACNLFIVQNSSFGVFNTPPFLKNDNSSKSYLFSSIQSSSAPLSVTVSRTNSSTYTEARERLEALQKISEHLPPWVYIYLQQEDKYGVPALIMQQGKTYFFITPS